jgi:hypothetical protein
MPLIGLLAGGRLRRQRRGRVYGAAAAVIGLCIVLILDGEDHDAGTMAGR